MRLIETTFTILFIFVTGMILAGSLIYWSHI